MTQHHQFVQQQTYFKSIDQTTDLGNYFYSLPVTYTSRNPFIFPSESRPLKIVNLADAFKSVDNQFAVTYYTKDGQPFFFLFFLTNFTISHTYISILQMNKKIVQLH